jgi:hypothetical protein
MSPPASIAPLPPHMRGDSSLGRVSIPRREQAPSLNFSPRFSPLCLSAIIFRLVKILADSATQIFALQVRVQDQGHREKVSLTISTVNLWQPMKLKASELIGASTARIRRGESDKYWWEDSQNRVRTWN